MTNKFQLYQLRKNDGVAYIGVDYQIDFINNSKHSEWDVADRAAESFVKNAKGSDTIILTKSEHPKDHFSFTDLGEHCIKGTKGVKIHPYLTQNLDNVIVVTKNSMLSDPPDSYSAFEAERLRPKEKVENIIKNEKVLEIHIGGFGHAWDIVQTAFDSAALGYRTIIHIDCVFPTIVDEDIERLLDHEIQIV